MQNKIILTPVDTLVNYVKENKNISINKLVKKLQIEKNLVEKWLVILEEYNILKIHYKGLEGFIQLNKKETNSENENEHNDNNSENEKELDIKNLKQQFLFKVKKRGYSDKELEYLWKNYINVHQEEIKNQFFKTAKKKGHNNTVSEMAWEKYKKELTKF